MNESQETITAAAYVVTDFRIGHDEDKNVVGITLTFRSDTAEGTETRTYALAPAALPEFIRQLQWAQDQLQEPKRS